MSGEPPGRDRRTTDGAGGRCTSGQQREAAWRRFTGDFADEEVWPDGGRRGGADSAERPTEPTVLVESDDVALVRAASLSVLDGQFAPGDGAVVVGRGSDVPEVVERVRATVRGLSDDCVAAVDLDPAGETGADDISPVRVSRLGAGSNAMADAVAEASRTVAERTPGRIHLYVDGIVSSPGESTDAVYDRLYELAMRVGADPGLALFGLDRGAVGAGLRERLPHLFDVRVTLRERRGEPEVRWTAVTGTSDGWQSLRALSFEASAFA